MKRAIFALTAALFAPMVATAQEAAPGASWQGAYVGGSILHGQTEAMAVGGWADWIDDTFPDKGHLLGKPDGTTAALRAGYDFDLGQIVLGAGVE